MLYQIRANNLLLGLLASILFGLGCERPVESQLPQEVIDLINQGSELDLFSVEGQAYRTGEAFKFQSDTMPDSSVVYIIEDGGGYYSGASGITHWIVIKKHSTCQIALETYGNNFRFINHSSSQWKDIQFNYSVERSGGPEYRNGIFTWTGSNYELRRLDTINGQPVIIPVDLLQSIGFYFSQLEKPKLKLPDNGIVYDSISTQVVALNSQSDSLCLIKIHKRVDSTYSYLFFRKDSEWTLQQRIPDNIYIKSSDELPVEIGIIYFDVVDSLLHADSEYVWINDHYEMHARK